MTSCCLWGLYLYVLSILSFESKDYHELKTVANACHDHSWFEQLKWSRRKDVDCLEAKRISFRWWPLGCRQWDMIWVCVCSVIRCPGSCGSCMCRSSSVYRPRVAAQALCLILLCCHIDCPPASSANLGLHPPAHGTRRRASLGGTMWQPQMLRCTWRSVCAPLCLNLRTCVLALHILRRVLRRSRWCILVHQCRAHEIKILISTDETCLSKVVLTGKLGTGGFC